MQPTPLASASAPARARRVFVLAIVALLGLGTHACSRCAAVQSRYDERLRDELARNGTGGRTDAALEDHLQLVLAPADVERLADGILRAEWLRSVVGQRNVQTPLGAALLEVELVPRVSAFRARPPRGEYDAELEIELVVYARLAGAGQRIRSTANTRGRLDVALALENGPEPALVLDATRAVAAIEPVELAGLPDGARTMAESLVRELFEEALRQAPRTLDVARFGELDVGVRRLPLTASSLRIHQSGALCIGFVTELRPRGSALPPLRPDAESGWRLRADLPRAALEYLVSVGAAPRRFDEVGRATAAGAYAVTPDTLAWGEGEITTTFDWWCLEGRRCTVEPVDLRLPTDWSASGLSFGAASSTSPSPLGRFRGFVENASAITRGLAAGAELELASGARIRVQAQRAVVEDTRLDAVPGGGGSVFVVGEVVDVARP